MLPVGSSFCMHYKCMSCVRSVRSSQLPFSYDVPHRLLFSYEILTPAALNFFVDYADGAVESLWSIDQYFEFVLVLMLSTGLSFQVCWYAVFTQ